MIRDHWFRATYAHQPCTYRACGQPQSEHVQSVGEWREPRCVFRPNMRRPSFCALCKRHHAHTTHRSGFPGEDRRHPRSRRRASIAAVREAYRRWAADRRLDRELSRLIRKEPLLPTVSADETRDPDYCWICQRKCGSSAHR